MRFREHSHYALACAVLGVSASAYGADPTTAELMQQLEQLKAKVQQLEQAQQNAVTREDVSATVQAVLKDADQRSQLFAADGFTAGWTDGKFLLRSGDGNFVLHPWLQLQIRNTTSWRIDGKQPNNSDDIENGFEIRRLKYGVDGNAFCKELTYAIQFQAGRKDGTPVLEDAFAKYQFADQWAVRVGQFKDPLAHDSLMSTRRTLTERSFTNDYFSQGENYVQGASLIYGAKSPLHAEAAFTDGSNIVTPIGTATNQNRNFQDWENTGADYGAAMRVEYLVMGDWKNYEDYTAMGTKDPLLVLGAGLDYTELGDTGFFTHTVDAQYELPSGLALYAAYYGRYTKDSPPGINSPNATTGITPVTNHQDLYDWGVVAQASYMLNSKWEVFGRYGYLNLDGDQLAAGLTDQIHEITVGANYYLKGHNAKFTLDFGYLPNGAPISDDGAGILKNNDPDFYMRGTFQLLL